MVDAFFLWVEANDVPFFAVFWAMVGGVFLVFGTIFSLLDVLVKWLKK